MKGREPRGFLIGFRKFSLQHLCVALLLAIESSCDETAVALVRGEEATLKYLRKEGGQVRLDPANAAYDPQYYRPDEVQVQGKLAGLLRRYH